MKINMSLQTRLLTLSHTQSATAATGSTFETKKFQFFSTFMSRRIYYIVETKKHHMPELDSVLQLLNLTQEIQSNFLSLNTLFF